MILKIFKRKRKRPKEIKYFEPWHLEIGKCRVCELAKKIPSGD